MSGRATWTVSALATFAALAVPAVAGAKVSCEYRGERIDADRVSGLPSEPVAGRTYAVTLASRGMTVIDSSPNLTVLDCAGPGPEPADLDGFRLAQTGAPGKYTADVSFPGPGRRTVSVTGLRPAHIDLGAYQVRAAITAAHPQADIGRPSATGPPLWPLAVLVGLLSVGAGALAWRRARSPAAR